MFVILSNASKPLRGFRRNLASGSGGQFVRILSEPQGEPRGTSRMKRDAACGAVPIHIGRSQLAAALEALIDDFETLDAIRGLSHPGGFKTPFQFLRDLLIFEPLGMASFKVFGSDNHNGIVVELSNDANSREAAPIPSGIRGRAPHRAYTKGQGNHPPRRAVPFFALHSRPAIGRRGAVPDFAPVTGAISSRLA